MTDFQGFPKELPAFFKSLKKNNTKEWFQENKKDYEVHVKHPSEEFVVAMGEKLRTISPEINAIPKVNKSLFRINRDTRFAKDKSPYKTNLGILFWDGPGKRMENSGFYFHLEEDYVMLGCGMHTMTQKSLQAYREALTDKKAGPKLGKVIQTLKSKKYLIANEHYKRVPRGFEANTEFEEKMLRFNGLTARVEMPVPSELYSYKILDLVFDHFKAMSPIHNWVTKFVD